MKLFLSVLTLAAAVLTALTFVIDRRRCSINQRLHKYVTLTKRDGDSATI